MSQGTGATPRCAAIVGPHLCGKTTLLESLLFATGAITRKGSVREGNTVGDSSAEARARQTSVELSVARAEYLGDEWVFLDCPGSIELAQETVNALTAVDAAVVVCEPVTERALTVAPLFRMLDERNIPHMVFINKVDTASERIPEIIAALQSFSDRRLVLRQVAFRNGDTIAGYVDLVSERAYEYAAEGPSKLVPVPDSIQEREQLARTGGHGCRRRAHP